MDSVRPTSLHITSHLIASTAVKVYHYTYPPVSQKTQSLIIEELNRLPTLLNGHICRVYRVKWTGNTLNITQEALSSDFLPLSQFLSRQIAKRMYFSEAQAWKFIHEISLIINALQKFQVPYVYLSLEVLNIHSAGKCIKIEQWFDGFLQKAALPGLFQPPETHYDQKSDLRSSIWTFGVLIFKLLSFQGVFEGISAWPSAEQRFKLQHTPLPPCFSQKISDLVVKMMYKRPERRVNLTQIVAEIPLFVKMRYSQPEIGKDLEENEENMQEIKEKIEEKRTDFPETSLLKAPFRRFTVVHEKKPSFRQIQKPASARTRLNRSFSPAKLDLLPSVAVAEVQVSWSKGQTRGTSRLSSRESLSVSGGKQTRRSHSRPTIETLLLY